MVSTRIGAGYGVYEYKGSDICSYICVDSFTSAGLISPSSLRTHISQIVTHIETNLSLESEAKKEE